MAASGMSLADRRPVTLLICALGGEGGGVLAEWLVDTATRSGYSAQSTSIPGVAQRTGSTTYYFEVFPVPDAELGGRKPVFSLYPVAGALDVLVSSELLETVRHIGNGMTCADRTFVVTSSSRTLTTAEKLQLADGRTSSAGASGGMVMSPTTSRPGSPYLMESIRTTSSISSTNRALGRAVATARSPPCSCFGGVSTSG
jgi:Pyruvate/2-oxoacid:ferredoxin oxidoreductase gamma subunit